MFRLNPSPTFPYPVELTVPGKDAAEKLSLTFKHQVKQDLDDWIKRAATAVMGDGSDDSVLLEVVVGWGDVGDGALVPFSVEAFKTLTRNYPASGGEIVRTYIRAMTESRAKN